MNGKTYFNYKSLRMYCNDDFAINSLLTEEVGEFLNYTQTHKYDHLSNILQMRSINNWTRDYFYSTNNYLLGHESGQTD